MKVIRPGHKYELDHFEANNNSPASAVMARELCHEIEMLPAGEQQTKVSLLASKLNRAIWEEHPFNQTLQFIEKEPSKDPAAAPGTLVTVFNGTTNEEVLRVLIDRMQSLQAKFPCRENAIVTTKLEESLMWLEKRTRDRQARNVEGKHLA